MASVTLKNLSKTYPGDVEAVKNVDLEIKDKEFVIFVGPSGCGKSTVLRMIAGIEEITDGEVFIDSKPMNGIPAKDRNISMVFQNYALFPHLTVYENIAFGLRARKFSKVEIEELVPNAAKILGIEHLLQRKPKQLSGGERQRVAMGRAIVRNPSVFLMDEPLANLDALLRVKMRMELSLLHKRLQNTFIFVTHDQTEAMTLGDRIVVMKDGLIQQIGQPDEVYNYPANKFVAGFIGLPQMNFITEMVGDQKITLGIRAESVIIRNMDKNFENTLELGPGRERKAIIEFIELLGFETLLYLRILGEEQEIKIVARVQPNTDFRIGEQVSICFDLGHIHYFHPETGIRMESL